MSGCDMRSAGEVRVYPDEANSASYWLGEINSSFEPSRAEHAR